MLSRAMRTCTTAYHGCHRKHEDIIIIPFCWHACCMQHAHACYSRRDMQAREWLLAMCISPKVDEVGLCDKAWQHRATYPHSFLGTCISITGTLSSAWRPPVTAAAGLVVAWFLHRTERSDVAQAYAGEDTDREGDLAAIIHSKPEAVWGLQPANTRGPAAAQSVPEFLRSCHKSLRLYLDLLLQVNQANESYCFLPESSAYATEAGDILCSCRRLS